MLTAVRIISFSALAFAVLASAALAEELTDAGMDQITAGGFFELAADELDMTTSAPVVPHPIFRTQGSAMRPRGL